MMLLSHLLHAQMCSRAHTSSLLPSLDKRQTKLEYAFKDQEKKNDQTNERLKSIGEMVGELQKSQENVEEKSNKNNEAIAALNDEIHILEKNVNKQNRKFERALGRRSRVAICMHVASRDGCAGPLSLLSVSITSCQNPTHHLPFHNPPIPQWRQKTDKKKKKEEEKKNRNQEASRIRAVHQHAH